MTNTQSPDLLTCPAASLAALLALAFASACTSSPDAPADGGHADGDVTQLDASGLGDGGGDVCGPDRGKLTAEDGADYDNLGRSVSVWNDTLVVGAPGHANHGAAYVYARDGSCWTLRQTLTGDTSDPSSFGYSVDFDGDTIIVGAPDDDASGLDSGAAYVFVDGGEAWTLQQRLEMVGPANAQYFGRSVSVSGDTAVVAVAGPRSAYIFERSGTVWTQRQILVKPPASDTGDYFATTSVSVWDDTLLVGAPDDFDGWEQGSVSVYVRGDSLWEEQAILKPTAGRGNRFGEAVDLHANTAVIGSPDDIDQGEASGSAFVFVREGEPWIAQQRLLLDDSDAHPFGKLGFAVAASGDRVLIGSGGLNTAYSFERNQGSWIQQRAVRPDDLDDPTDFTAFGRAVSLDGTLAVVGAFMDDTRDYDAGAAYLFDL